MCCGWSRPNILVIQAHQMVGKASILINFDGLTMAMISILLVVVYTEVNRVSVPDVPDVPDVVRACFPVVVGHWSQAPDRKNVSPSWIQQILPLSDSFTNKTLGSFFLFLSCTTFKLTTTYSARWSSSSQHLQMTGPFATFLWAAAAAAYLEGLGGENSHDERGGTLPYWIFGGELWTIRASRASRASRILWIFTITYIDTQLTNLPVETLQ